MFAAVVLAQQPVSFPAQDGGRISGELYGKGPRGVVLAHGGRFKKESWRPQARVLEDKGYHVLSFDFRDTNNATHLEVLAAVDYLRLHGASTVSVVGGSMGGSAAGDASIVAKPGTIDRLVLLGGAPNLPASGLKSPVLFLVARDDANAGGPRLPGIRAQFNQAPQPKELIVVEGAAHAQFLFQTEQGERVMGEILRFLRAE